MKYFLSIAYLVVCIFSKENNHFSRENLPKNNLQVSIFDKSKSFSPNQRYSQVTLKKTIFNDEDCQNLDDTYMNVDVKISGCQSINKRITFLSNNPKGNTVSISNSIFIFSSSLSEKSMLVFQGTLLDIFNVTIKFSTEGQLFSSSIFECSDLPVSSSPSINFLTFVDCILDSDKSVFKLTNYPEITFTNLLFEGKNVQCKSILESDSISSAYFNNCNFSNFNEKSTIFALNYIKGELSFASCNFFNNKCSLFYLSESQTNLRTFDSCHFFDSNATNILSFIYLLGDQTAQPIKQSIFIDCQFSNNFIYSTTNDEKRYGTVIGLSTSLHFEGTNKFTNCQTISIDQSDVSNTKNFGGALSIFHVNSEIYELMNCSFDCCSATNIGGGFFSFVLTDLIDSDKSASLQLTNCNFTGCWSFENGGGFSCGTRTELKVSTSLFKGCNSPVGGGIFFSGIDEQAVFSSTTFDNCDGKNGTAFNIRTSQFSFENSYIVNHFSPNNDKDEYETTCIYLYTTNEKIKITFSEVHFNNNSGQSIEICTPYTNQLETVNTFKNCEFNGNNKFSDKYTLINCERVQSSITIFNNCSFIDNKGRCISSEMIYCKSLMIFLCNFIGNDGPNGACLGVYLDRPENKVLTLHGSIFRENTANSGSIVCIRNIEFADVGINIFKDNKMLNEAKVGDESKSCCSALFVELTQPKPLSLSNFIFDNCVSEKSGAAVYASTSILNKEAKIDFTNFSFTNNKNNENGGAVFIETSDLASILIIDSYFTHNVAKNGGSIFIAEKTSESSCLVDIWNCQFIKDEALESGGSIFMSAKNGATIDCCNFTQPKAAVNGKAISIDLYSCINMNKCNFYVEKDSIENSAIYVFSSFVQKQRSFDGELLIKGGCFVCNKKGGKATFLIFNVSQASKLKITHDSCFQLSKEESILVIGSSTTIDADDSVFNRNDCNGIPIPPDDDKKVLTTLLIVAIVLMVVAIICLVVLIVYVVKKRKERNDDDLNKSVYSVNLLQTV